MLVDGALQDTGLLWCRAQSQYNPSIDTERIF